MALPAPALSSLLAAGSQSAVLAAAVLRIGFPQRMPNVSSVTDPRAAHTARYDR